MNIEDKLPKAEDVYKTSWNLLANGELDQPAIIHAMHEYTRQVLDVVAENATYQNTTGYGHNLLNTESILKFKELLK